MDQSEIATALSTARQALAERKPHEAISLLSNAQPPSAEVSSLLGAAYSQAGDLNAALTHFQKAVSAQPTPRNYFNLAALHKMRGSADEARTALQEALRLDPSYDKARQMLGQLPPPPAQSAPEPTVVLPPLDAQIGQAPPATPYPQDPQINPFAPTAHDPIASMQQPDQPPPAPKKEIRIPVCSRIVAALEEWWAYIGWGAFLACLIMPLVSGCPLVVSLFLCVVLLAWWFIDIVDQQVPWYKVLGGVLLLGISSLGFGSLFLRVGTWVIYWTRVRE